MARRRLIRARRTGPRPGAPPRSGVAWRHRAEARPASNAGRVEGVAAGIATSCHPAHLLRLPSAALRPAVRRGTPSRARTRG